MAIARTQGSSDCFLHRDYEDRDYQVAEKCAPKTESSIAPAFGIR